jgi:hypothetical protein
MIVRARSINDWSGDLQRLRTLRTVVGAGVLVVLALVAAGITYAVRRRTR